MSEREERGEGEERTSSLLQSVSFGFVFFLTYFVSCNGPCALKEKLFIKEHNIISESLRGTHGWASPV